MARQGLVLPSPAPAVGSYVQAKVHGDLVFVTGQLAFINGVITHPGVIGREITAAQGVAAASAATLNSVAAAAAAVGGVDALSGVVQAVGYFACTDDFSELSMVMNAVSDTLGKVFGGAAAHTRSTVGVYTLPLNSAVEIQVTFALE